MDQTLAVFILPPADRQRLKSMSRAEHDHAEIRRRVRVVRIFPRDARQLRLTYPLAIEWNEKWLERRSLIMPEVPRFDTELKQRA